MALDDLVLYNIIQYVPHKHKARTFALVNTQMYNVFCVYIRSIIKNDQCADPYIDVYYILGRIRSVTAMNLYSEYITSFNALLWNAEDDDNDFIVRWILDFGHINEVTDNEEPGSPGSPSSDDSVYLYDLSVCIWDAHYHNKEKILSYFYGDGVRHLSTHGVSNSLHVFCDRCRLSTIKLIYEHNKTLHTKDYLTNCITRAWYNRDPEVCKFIKNKRDEQT